MTIKACTHTPTFAGLGLESVLVSADSCTDFMIDDRLSILNMLDIYMLMQSADWDWGTIAAGQPQIGLVGMGLQAYIPLRCKIIRVGYWHWLGHPTLQFCATYTNMLVSKNAKNLRHPMQNPNASQWNIGCVGFQMQIFALSMYISCFLC